MEVLRRCKLSTGVYLCSLFVLFFSASDGATLTQDCMIEKENNIYDLTALAYKDYWSHLEEDRYEYDLQFYISVCHPLRNLPKESYCSNSTGSDVTVCVEQLKKNDSIPLKERFQKLAIANAGRLHPNISESSIKVAHGGWVEYTYQSGMECEESHHGKKLNYKTTLNLLCPSIGTQETESPILMSFHRCELLFAWLTKAACPIENKKSKITTCQDKFIGSEATLNLHSLHVANYYNISSSRKFQMNVCGAIKDGLCTTPNTTVCDITDYHDPKTISTTNDMEVMWHGSIFTLHYNHETPQFKLPPNQKEVVVQFQCDRTEHDPKISYVATNTTHVIFSAKTHAVCTPMKQECVFTDRKGHVYDLRPLHKQQTNWVVLDNREENMDVLYHINICEPLVETGFFGCEAADSGACLSKMNSQSAYNLGLLVSDPVVNEDGTITVIYNGGDPCDNKQHVRSTRIILSCDSYQQDPVFIEETSTCEYIFHWHTPYACPRHVVSSNNCTVTDPLFGHTFDLRPLRNNLSDYSSSDGSHTFYVNMCGPLVGNNYDGLPSGSSIAMVKDKESNYFSGGKFPGKLTFRDGTLVERLSGGSICRDNETYSSQIIYMCDHDAEDSQAGLSVFRLYDSCTFNMIMRTKHACPPHTIIDCSLTTKEGLKYDLNPLSQSNLNHMETDNRHNVKYVLNVCRTIIHGKDFRCAYDSASCLIDLSNKNLSLNLGKVGSGPYLEDGLLKLKYTDGDKCNATHNYSTEIVFECDEDDSLPYPTIVARENCKYIHEWKTSHACPVKIETLPAFGNCTVMNTFSNQLLDFTSLKRTEGYTTGNGNTVLRLNVCGRVASCTDGAHGACSVGDDGQMVSAGIASANISFTKGSITLKYEGGSKCSNGVARSTLISFFCGAEESIKGPIFVSKDDTSCTYFVNWHTELACVKRIDCFARTRSGNVDISPLIKHYGNYEVSRPNSSDKFYINICRPLNHIRNVFCDAGSSACLVHDNSDPPEGIGKPLLIPTEVGKNSVMIMYPLGGSCASIPAMKYSTRITLECDRSAGKGAPVFSQFTHDCQYQFTWKTSLVCPKELPVDDTTCSLMHHEAKTNIQMRDLHKPNGYRVAFDSKVYLLNICGSVCSDDSGVCSNNSVSYGRITHSQFKWLGSNLELFYFGGDDCSSALAGKRAASILFECDPSAGYGEPEADPVMKGLECMATFKWRTNVTCIDTIYSTVSPNIVTTELPNTTTLPSNSNAISQKSEKSSSGGHSTLIATLLIILVVALTALLVYCYRNGHITRFYNRVKMATVLPQHYSSRHGGILLNDELSS